MPPVIHLQDQPNKVNVSEYPTYAKFGNGKFTEFNVVQSRIFEVFNKDANIIIAARTSAGKTVCSEMVMAHEVRERGGKAMYLAPLKALAKEKQDDWTNPEHHFADLGLAICTGDYRLTPARKKEIEDAKLILMTSEMLNSRCRNFKSEQNDWLKEVGTLVVDESHLLTVGGRGDHLEVGLMKFCEIAPNARIVFLSATMPNVAEIADWVSYVLTKRDTYLINSEYRPCPLGIYYETYDSSGSYAENEEEKVNTALNIINDNPDDKFLLFVHTKATGEMAKRSLLRAGYDCEFHNADLDKEKRHALENRFKTDPKFQVIIATSTLAWGLNLPARRVIITGVHRGLNEVENYDVWQMAGRAGRVGLDPRGDVYILVPYKEKDYHQNRLDNPQKITSRLLDYVGKPEKPHYKTLAFHLVSEIHHGGIKSKEDVHNWYSKSLANFQAQDFTDDIVNSTMELLMRCGAVKFENDEFSVTAVGKISSMFYYSPFDVADLRRNFKGIFDNHLEDNDLLVSVALGNTDSIRMGYVSKAESEEMGAYMGKIKKMFPSLRIEATALKGGFAYYALMNGLPVQAFNALCRNAQFDFPRMASILTAVDSMSCKWDRKDWFRTLQQRVNYGVRKELVGLVTVPNIGKARAEKLYAAGLKTASDIANNPVAVARALNMKKPTVDKIVADAKTIALVS